MSPVPHQRSLSQTAGLPSMPSYSRPSSAGRPTPITLYVGGQFAGGCDIVREAIEQQIPNSRAAVDSLKTQPPARLEPGFAGHGWPPRF